MKTQEELNKESGRMNDLRSIIEDVNKSDIISNKVIKKIIEKIGQEE